MTDSKASTYVPHPTRPDPSLTERTRTTWFDRFLDRLRALLNANERNQ